MSWLRLVPVDGPTRGRYASIPHYPQGTSPEWHCTCDKQFRMFLTPEDRFCGRCIDNSERGGAAISNPHIADLLEAARFQQVLAFLRYHTFHFWQMFLGYEESQTHWQDRIYAHRRGVLADALQIPDAERAEFSLNAEGYGDVLQVRNGPVPDNQSICYICQGQLRHQDEPDEGVFNCTDIDNLVFLPCNHTFGRACIESWIDIRVICPACNIDIRHMDMVEYLQGAIAKVFDNPPTEPSIWWDFYCALTHLPWPYDAVFSLCYRHAFWVFNPNEWYLDVRVYLMLYLTHVLALALAYSQSSLSVAASGLVGSTVLMAFIHPHTTQPVPPVRGRSSLAVMSKLKVLFTASLKAMHKISSAARIAVVLQHATSMCAWYVELSLLVQIFLDDRFRTSVLVLYAIVLPLLFWLFAILPLAWKPQYAGISWFLFAVLAPEWLFYVLYLFTLLILKNHFVWCLVMIVTRTVVVWLNWESEDLQE